MTMCLLCRKMRNPARSRALTALRWGSQRRPSLTQDGHFPAVSFRGQLVSNGQIFSNGVTDIFKSLFFGLALRSAARKTRYPDTVHFFGLHQRNRVAYRRQDISLEDLVEAAGVEPASEKARREETYVRFRFGSCRPPH